MKNNDILKQRAKELRNNTTSAENKLWRLIRNKQLGHKFRRQHIIGDYIADFICLEKNLIIELDGGQHQEQKSYDKARTEVLNRHGFRVVRYWNNDVMQNIEGVISDIIKYLE